MNKTLLFFTLLFLASCAGLRKLPQEHYYGFMPSFNKTYENDTISFHVKNPLMCPVTVKILTDTLNPGLDKLFGKITLTELQDTTIKIHYPNFDPTDSPGIRVNYGDLNRKIEKNQIALPFPKGRAYTVIQGYDGKFTHNKIDSQYAIDFNLSIGDTITSADNGYVVGVIEAYKKHGTSKAWRENDKSNFITVYHPHSGLYTQYVHLYHKGALVKLGDAVEKGQPIGISGMTGFTTIPHLHFNVKIPDEQYGLISTDIQFENGMTGKDLTNNNNVK